MGARQQRPFMKQQIRPSGQAGLVVEQTLTLARLLGSPLGGMGGRPPRAMSLCASAWVAQHRTPVSKVLKLSLARALALHRPYPALMLAPPPRSSPPPSGVTVHSHTLPDRS